MCGVECSCDVQLYVAMWCGIVCEIKCDVHFCKVRCGSVSVIQNDKCTAKCGLLWNVARDEVVVQHEMCWCDMKPGGMM